MNWLYCILYRCESLEEEGRAREERFSCLLQDLERSAILARDRERTAAQLSADLQRGRDEASAARQQLEAAQQDHRYLMSRLSFQVFYL
jgi:hypothetical protein